MTKKSFKCNEETPIRLNRFMLIHLRFFQYFGLCPVSMQLQDDHDHWQLKNHYHLVWLGFHLCAFITLHTFVIRNAQKLFYTTDSFGLFNDILKLSAAIIAHYVTLIEMIFRRKEMHRFLQIYTSLYRNRLQVDSSKYKKNSAYTFRRFICNYIGFFTIMWAIDINYLTNPSNSLQIVMYFISYMPSVLICRFRLIQLMLYLEMLRIEIENLNERLDELISSCLKLYEQGVKIAIGGNLEANILTELRSIMLHYSQIYDMCEVLKASLNWSTLLNYVKAYAQILVDCYWSYYMVYVGSDIVEYTLILPTVIIVLQLLLTSRNCMRSAQFFGHNIHKLRHNIENVRIAALIQNFSLQILHQQIVIDVHGFFVLNCDLARSILGSITTYMLFFIQFMPKFQTI
ncbi:gustatory receptor 8a-like [Teleopsis dalmanni]|uniref:gustatory receptor 8a-like n=1 Tax=Teleopsis dalmanni TaxID=139649 RepID=UPI0018CEB93B|nr:gustatory receptor 8a-like [Teleopsis dalmanni]